MRPAHLVCSRAAGVGHVDIVKLLLAANNVKVDVQDRYRTETADTGTHGSTPPLIQDLRKNNVRLVHDIMPVSEV